MLRALSCDVSKPAAASEVQGMLCALRGICCVHAKLAFAGKGVSVASTSVTQMGLLHVDS